MESLEVNKIVGAILVGGLVAMVTGSVAHELVNSEAPGRRDGGDPSGAAPSRRRPPPRRIEPVCPLLAKADPHGPADRQKCRLP